MALPASKPTETDALTPFCAAYTRAIEIIGRRWTGAILRSLLAGSSRYSEILANVPGLSDRLLSERLKELEAEGIIERRVTPSTPVRIEYVLTEKGRELLPVVLAMMKWGDRWASDEPPVRLTHTACGHETAPVVACEHCREELRWRDLQTDPIPVRLPERV